MPTEREHKVKIEKFHRPTNLEFLTRIDKILNLSGLAREVESCKHKQTLVSRINRHTDLNQTVEQKAFAEDIGEVLNEVWYILGVGLSKFPPDPHKKYKFFYNDDSERLKDKLDRLEELTEGK